MIRIDVTERWPALCTDRQALQQFILDRYGAARAELAPFPNAALYNAAGELLGYAQTHGFPRVTLADDRIYLDLADLVLSFGPERDDLREQLAAYAHEAWSGWMRYLFSKCDAQWNGRVIPPWAVERWQRQLATPYAELPEEEKASDRAEADTILALFEVRE